VPPGAICLILGSSARGQLILFCHVPAWRDMAVTWKEPAVPEKNLCVASYDPSTARSSAKRKPRGHLVKQCELKLPRVNEAVIAFLQVSVAVRSGR
jgi:hypothetical protein